MTAQPETLRLADRLRDGWGLELRREAEAELRRLHAQRDVLLMALRWIATVNAMDYEYQKVARAAIKAAEENT